MFDIYKDIESALKSYSQLELSLWNNQPILKGEFVAYNREMEVEIDKYNVLIQFPPNYPFAFPKVTETSFKIQPRNATRHIFQDDSLCFGNRFDEAKVCKGGITLSFFLEKILNTHLCREYVRECNGYYPTGERSHNMEGLWESFYELFETTDKSTILRHFESILTQNIGRNDPCYCGSRLKYKKCHQKLANEIINLGQKDAQEIYQLLQKDLNNYQ